MRLVMLVGVAGIVAAAVAAAIAVAYVLGGGLGPAPGASNATLLPAHDASPTPGPTDLIPVSAGPGTYATQTIPGSQPPAQSTPPSPTASPEANVGTPAKRIRIDRLGIDLAIVEGDGIDAPIGKAAHFPGSAWPGGGSNIYIYGHARKGMFLSLWGARPGDEIILSLADGTERTYVVSQVLPDVPWDAVEYLRATPTEQLTVQTSTSYYPTAPRFVVIALPKT